MKKIRKNVCTQEFQTFPSKFFIIFFNRLLVFNIFLGHSFGVSSASLILYLQISALYPIEKIVTPCEGMDISIATIRVGEGLLFALQLILLPLVFKTEKNCSTTPKLPKSINSNSLFLVIHQFRRKSCFSCVFSFSFSLCLSIYSCALSGTQSTFFGFW